MSTLTAPSKAAATAQLLTENWLRNVFPSDLYTVEAHPASMDANGEHPLVVVVTHAPNHGGPVPLLVVEVSDAPMSSEHEEAGRFAAAGIRDFWVIEVAARRLHVYRDPQPDPDARHGHTYQQVRVFSQNALVAPLAAELHLAQVANLLPW